MNYKLPLVLNTAEFGFLVRLDEETVRRKCRAREINARRGPWRIPVKELLKWGINLDDAAVALDEYYRTRMEFGNAA